LIHDQSPHKSIQHDVLSGGNLLILKRQKERIEYNASSGFISKSEGWILKIIIFVIAILCFCILPGAALQQNMYEKVDQYNINMQLLEDLNRNRTHIENNVTDLNNSRARSYEQIRNVDNNIKVLNSEISALESNIKENKKKINESELNKHRIDALSDRETTILLGISAGMIVGLWVTSLALFVFWRD
jgi:septal ring factor EnvC (AmiA/AmiB activator)